MKKFVPLFLFSFLIISGCTSSGGNNRPDWVHQVNWEGDIPEDANIETLLWKQITPYRSIEYDMVNITTTQAGDTIGILVKAGSTQSLYQDIYDFSYYNGTLVMTGYLLEVIPEADRIKALDIVFSEGAEIRQTITQSQSEPTVKRILPQTSEKFYKPKTLLSVTWQDVQVSALVDVDSYTIVEIWNQGGGNTES
jgi:hypothetical protein